MPTRADLYRKVLEKLQVVEADDPADASDTLLVRDQYTYVHAMLVKEKLVAWGLTSDDIPEYAMIPLTMMLAASCAREFGQEPTGYQQEAGGAWTMLRRLLAKDYIRHRVRAEYF